jgi:hypothetical protein
MKNADKKIPSLNRKNNEHKTRGFIPWTRIVKKTWQRFYFNREKNKIM